VREGEADYEAIIGMEVHAQLLTRSKMFCGCDADIYDAEPNSHVCPVCLGLPGALPVANRRAVEQAILAGLALNCQIAGTAVFARKNYFYPDLPKGYQITMYELPLCHDGWIEIDDPGGPGSGVKRIGIRRVHLEEDTARLSHAADHSLLDFNRAGLPLVEIVTQPDIRTPEEARGYLNKLQAILRYLGVSSGDMEKGAMRCEANVSLRPHGSETPGVRVEIKNLNSFRSVKLALAYEIERQAALLAAGGEVRQVTMGWEERHGRTVEQRAKEGVDDYRYFPEPDLPPLRVSRSWVDRVRAAMPELPDARRARFVADYGLSREEAALLVADRQVADYFDGVAALGRERGIDPRLAAPWVTGELFRLLKEKGGEINTIGVTPAALVELVALVQEGAITASSGKALLEEIASTGRSASEIVGEGGWTQISDPDALARVVEQVIAASPQQVRQYREGKEALLHWFVGQVMQATHGKANPQVALALLEERLRE
jgi:aspartyl-tRNA(Asn)/glutamyl-tRNA(Gln) amidotransferase subunit B